MSALLSVTNLADLAVLLPLSAIILIWLAGRPARRGAIFWALAVLLATGAIGIFKIYFHACSADPLIRSPSGHAGFGTLVYGALTLMLASSSRGPQRFAVVAAGITLVIAIAVSRVLLDAHSSAEVLVGVMTGLAALGIFSWGYLRPRQVSPSLWPVTVAVLVVILLLHGRQVRAEELLQRLGSMLQVGSIACPAPGR